VECDKAVAQERHRLQRFLSSAGYVYVSLCFIGVRDSVADGCLPAAWWMTSKLRDDRVRSSLAFPLSLRRGLMTLVVFSSSLDEKSW
jgi:hypothetical protein